MVRALNRIVETEFKSVKESSRHRSKTTPSLLPNKETIESIAVKSSGDIRSAVNMLQFTCLRGVANVAMVTIIAQ